MDTKLDPYIICYLLENHFRYRDTYTLKVREWKRVFDRHGNQKKARVTELQLTSDKIDFKIKTVTINKERHFITIKG